MMFKGKEFFKKNKEMLIVFVISIIFPLILLNKIIFSPGVILFWDFQMPIYPDRFVDYHTLIWDSTSSMSGMESVGRLFARLPFVFLAYIGMDVGIIEKLMFIFLYAIGIFSAYFFLRKVIYLEFIPSLFLSMTFVIFMHFFHNLHQYSPVFGGMIFPAIFSLFYLSLKHRKISPVIVSGILMITTLQMPFTFFMANFLILLYFIYRIISLKDIYVFKYYIYFMIIQIGIGCFYFLPLIINPPSVESINSNIATYEEVIRLSQRDGLYYPFIGFPINTFDFKIWSYYSDNILNKLQLLISIILLIILPFSALVVEKNKKHGNSIFFSIVLLILWQLSLGSMGILGDFYVKMVTEYSILNFMRSPQKFYLFIPFVTLGLLGTILGSINRKRLKISLSILFLISMIFISFPSILSWNNNMAPVNIPGEFGEVQKIIDEDFQNGGEYFRTIWYPEYVTTGTTWAPDTKILGFDQRSSKVPVYSYTRAGFRQDFIFTTYLWRFLINNKTEMVSNFLDQYRVKYIIFHDDIIYDKGNLRLQKDTNDVLANLLSSENFELKYKKNFMYLFENKNYKSGSYVFANDDESIMVESFSLQDSMRYTNQNYFFLDDGFSETLDTFNRSKNVIMTNFTNYLNNIIYYDISSDHYYFPGKQNFRSDPNDFWAVKGGWDINPRFNEYFRYYIYNKFDDYQLDLGKRIIATKGKNVTTYYNITTDKYNKYVFMVRLFENMNGGQIEIQLDNLSYIVDTNSEKNIFVWKEIDRVNLTSGSHHLSLKNIDGFDAVNIIGLIPEEEYNRAKEDMIKILYDKHISYVFDANNNEVSEQNIEIVNYGNYTVTLIGKGKFNFTMDNKSSILETDLSNFTQFYRLNLSPGSHTFKLLPIDMRVNNLMENSHFKDNNSQLSDVWKLYNNESFNVEMISLNDKDYALKLSTSTIRKGVWSWLRNTPIDIKKGKRYLFSVDMKIENSYSSHIPIEGYSDQTNTWKQLSQCPIGSIGTGTFDWKQFTCIIDSGNATKIRVVLNAGSVLDIDNGNATTWFDNLGIYDLDDLPYLDTLLLSPEYDKSNLNKNESTKILNFERINPTLLNVKINTTSPFILSFAEAYDSSWEAIIYKNGINIKTIKSIPIYSLINGFYIDETGTFEIMIKFKTQKWFEIGLIISAMTFIGCIGYILYDRRNNNK